MEVFEIDVEPWQNFDFYARNDILTLSSDMAFPQPKPCSSIYTPSTGITRMTPMLGQYGHTCPVLCLVKEQDYISCIEDQLPSLTTETWNAYDRIGNPNIFVFRQKLGDDAWIIGLCGVNMKSDKKPNERFTAIVTKCLKFLTFA